MTIIILTFAVAAGAILGFRHFRVWSLAPLIAFAASGIVANGIVTGLDRRNFVLALLAAIVCPQIGYLLNAARLLIAPKEVLPRSEPSLYDWPLSNYRNFGRNRNYTQARTASARHSL